jgi:hypothetical protein
VASYAAWHGLRQQRTLNKAYRVMREGLEHYLWPQIAPFVRPPGESGLTAPIAHVESEPDRRQNIIAVWTDAVNCAPSQMVLASGLTPW